MMIVVNQLLHACTTLFDCDILFVHASRTIFDNVEIARQKELKKTVEWQQPNADLRRMKSGKWGTFK